MVMRHGGLTGIGMVVAVALISGARAPVRAVGMEFPHLIQTVTERDLFEGMLALGFLECTVLRTDDCDKAYGNVQDGIVQIIMDGAYGSGVVWEMTPEQVVIATNKHVLAYWEDRESYVRFAKGYEAKATIVGISPQYDVGFLAVENQESDYLELERIRYVHKDLEAYQELKTGDMIFCVGADAAVSAESEANYYQGSIGDMWRYIEEFEGYMIYGYGYAREGMSGGGTFDARGNLIGIFSGATEGGETASVPLPLVMEAYEQVRLR